MPTNKVTGAVYFELRSGKSFICHQSECSFRYGTNNIYSIKTDWEEIKVADLMEFGQMTPEGRKVLWKAE